MSSNETRLNRSIPRVTPSRIRYEDSDGMEYGNGPDDLLTRAKYEETNAGPDEDLYDNYARGTLTDWGPDTAQLAHEESRGAVNRSKGLLQHHYYGHRGCEDVDRPELFLGFAGPENADPRGINVDPDMRVFRAQSEARNRFIRLTPDDSAFVTGGGRSQGQLQADQQTLQRFVRDRLRVFDRQMDGRREGMRRTQAQTQSVAKYVEQVQGYGDLIRDYALNPQRRANLICRQAIRDSKAWREGTADQDFQFARYTQICKSGRTKDTFQRVLETRNADDTAWEDGDLSVPYKAMGMLMAAIIASNRKRAGAVADSDRDYGDHTATVARKTVSQSRDLEALMYAIVAGGEFAATDDTRVGKTATPQERQHLARTQQTNHLTPAHHYLNAEIVYKSMRQGDDLSKIQQKVIGDGKTLQTEDTTSVGKSARMQRVTGAKLHTDEDTDRAEDNRAVYSYKGLKPSKGVSKVAGVDGDASAAESDATQARQTSKTEYRVTNKGDVEHMTMMLNNTSKERRSGPLGSKYTMRQIDRDGALSELS